MADVMVPMIRILFILPLFICCLGLAEEPKAKTAVEMQEKATFAGGCFWCMQPPFDKLEGVIKTVVGYTGGKKANPTYREVASGQTKHAEAVEVYYDPRKIGYKKLLEVFWRNINPTDAGGQFVDRGKQYRSEIFFHDEKQKKLAEESRKLLDQSRRFKVPIVTAITKAGAFYVAEDYHQSYYKKNPLRYKYYRYGSGRDKFIEKFWGKSK